MLLCVVMTQISLNHLSACEYLMFPQGFGLYKQAVIQYLQLKHLVYTDQDEKIKSKSDVIPHSPATIPNSPDVIPHCPDVTPHYPERFVSIGAGQWLDIWDNVLISPQDPFFDVFFAYHLRQLDIMKTDQYLKSCIDDGITMRFIWLLLLKHAKLFTPVQVQVISSWIEENKNNQTCHQSDVQHIKGRPKRQQGDRLTALSQEQTALLISYLQKGNVTFKGDYLTNTQAAQAFELLTGYSSEKLRKVLTREELTRISDKRNLTAMHETLTKLAILVNQDIKNLNNQ